MSRNQGRGRRSILNQNPPPRLPDWIRARSPLGAATEDVRRILGHYRLNTVCQSAACPNLGQCYAEGTATFMILGLTCTRDCRFCAVAAGRPEEADPSEPVRVAMATRDSGSPARGGHLGHP